MDERKKQVADIAIGKHPLPRSVRYAGRSGQDGAQRGAKRSRLGNAHERAFYVSPHGWRNDPVRYARICKRVDALQ